MTIHEILSGVSKLLRELLLESYEANKQEDPRRAFVHRHARNILELGDDFAALDTEGRTYGSRILIRPMLESLFKLVAATKRESYAVEKMIAEIEDDIERTKKWGNSITPDNDTTVREVTTLLSGFVQDLRQKHGITSKNSWNVYETAKLADLGWSYAQDYFQFSKHTHATLSGVIGQEDNIGPKHSCITACYITATAVVYSAGILNLKAPQKYVDNATEYIEAVVSFMEKRSK